MADKEILNNKGKRRLQVDGICYLGGAERETEAISAWVKDLGGRKSMSHSFGEIRLEEVKREKFRNRDVTRFRVVGE